jgi:hypothetical protein
MMSYPTRLRSSTMVGFFLLIVVLVGSSGCKKPQVPAKESLEKKYPCKIEILGEVATVNGLAELDNDKLGGLAKELETYTVDLNLKDTKINAEGMQHLKKLTQLRELNLAGLKLNNDSLANLKELQLIQLHLEGTGISDDGLAHLSSLLEMRRLFLDNNPGITGKGLTHLVGLVELRDLRLRQTKVDDEGILRLKSLLQLEDLWLNGVESVTKPGIKKLEDALPNLTVHH